MIGIGEIVGVISILVVRGILERILVNFEPLKHSLIIEGTPLLGLYSVNIREDAFHCIAVESIVKLVQVKVVKDAKVVEHGRNHPSSCGN